MDRARRAVVLSLPLAGVVVLGLLASQAQDLGPQTARIVDERLAGLPESGRALATELYGKAKAVPGGDNLIFSPFSISSAAGMAYAGARGETEKQIAKVMHFDANQTTVHAGFRELTARLREAGNRGHNQLNLANTLWVQREYEVKKSFLDRLELNYGAAPRQADFIRGSERARGEINRWAAKETRGKINEVVGPGSVDATTRLVLVNAVYFRGFWSSKFDKEATKDHDFTLADGRKIQTATMYQENNFRYAETEDLQALVLPYEETGFSMMILLPKGEKGLEHLEGLLSRDRLRQWELLLERARVQVHLPRFSMRRHLRLNGILADLGVPDAFRLKVADFSGIAEVGPGGVGDAEGGGRREPLYIQQFEHEALVEVDEEGTVAAAATGISIGCSAPPPNFPKRVFRADHPFVFLIQDDRSGSILFMGRVMNPAG